MAWGVSMKPEHIRKRAAYHRKYYEKNREKINAYNRKYREENREKIQAQQRKYRKEICKKCKRKKCRCAALMFGNGEEE